MSAVLARPAPWPGQPPLPLDSHWALDPHDPLVTMAAIGAGYARSAGGPGDTVQPGQAIQTVAAMNSVKSRLSWQPVTAINTRLASVTFRALQ